jgi:hypothetical protein
MRTTIVFGVLGTFFALIGIIVSALTLRVMYQAHGGRHDLESLSPSSIQMQTIRFHDTSRDNDIARDTMNDSVERRLTEDTMVGQDAAPRLACGRYMQDANAENALRNEVFEGQSVVIGSDVVEEAKSDNSK